MYTLSNDRRRQDDLSEWYDDAEPRTTLTSMVTNEERRRYKLLAREEALAEQPRNPYARVDEVSALARMAADWLVNYSGPPWHALVSFITKHGYERLVRIRRQDEARQRLALITAARRMSEKFPPPGRRFLVFATAPNAPNYPIASPLTRSGSSTFAPM